MLNNSVFFNIGLLNNQPCFKKSGIALIPGGKQAIPVCFKA